MRLFRYLILGLALAASVVSAQTYPDKAKTFKFILAQGAGSTTDALARAVGRAMTDVAGVNTIVEYKPGGDTVIGVQALLSAPSDGYAMMLVSSSTFVLNPVLMPNLPYDAFKDLIPLAAVSKVSLAMNLGPSTTFKSAREFVAAAKANPGKYTYAQSTPVSKLAGELLQANAGIKLLEIPYKTTAAALTAVASGEVDVMFNDVASSTALWQTGRVRAVAMASPARLPSMSHLPTMREEGVPDYDAGGWFVVFFARGTPPDVVAAMRDILRKALKSPVMIETFAKFSMEPLTMVGDEVTAEMRREVDAVTKLVRTANIKF